MRDLIYVFIYKVFVFLIRVLPQRVMLKLLQGLAFFAYHVGREHRYIINQNLSLIFKNLSNKQKATIGKKSYLNLLDNIVGMVRRGFQSDQEILDSLTFENSHILTDAIKNGRKIIIITAHYGNWEIIPTALFLKFGVVMSVVGRDLNSKPMQEILKKNREKFQMKLINKKGAIKGMIQALNQNRVVGILVDQSLPAKNSVDVKFFNLTTTHTPAASIIARKFDALLIPLFVSSDDYQNYKLTFFEPISPNYSNNKDQDILQMTQAQADIVQKVIQNRPHEWFWMHKRFKVYNPNMYNFNSQ